MAVGYHRLYTSGIGLVETIERRLDSPNTSINETLIKLESQKEELRKTITTSEELIQRIIKSKIKVEDVFALIEHIIKNFSKLSSYRKMEILKDIFVSIEVFPYYLKLTYGEGTKYELLFKPESAESYLLKGDDSEKKPDAPHRNPEAGCSDVIQLIGPDRLRTCDP